MITSAKQKKTSSEIFTINNPFFIIWWAIALLIVPFNEEKIVFLCLLVTFWLILTFIKDAVESALTEKSTAVNLVLRSNNIVHKKLFSIRWHTARIQTWWHNATRNYTMLYWYQSVTDAQVL